RHLSRNPPLSILSSNSIATHQSLNLSLRITERDDHLVKALVPSRLDHQSSVYNRDCVRVAASDFGEQRILLFNYSGVNDLIKLPASLGVREDDPAQLGPVDGSILVQYLSAEFVHNLVIGLLPGRHHRMRNPVGIECDTAQL